MDIHFAQLQDVYALGERMCAALEAGDVDGFMGLVQERGALLALLPPAHAVRKETDAWQAMGVRLRQQHETLEALAARFEAGMQESLQNLARLKGARKSYRTGPVGRGILDRRLRV